MPELPEIIHFKHYVDSTCLKQTISDIEVRKEDVLSNCTTAELSAKLKGEMFEKTSHYGKYLFIHSTGSHDLVMHFGMTGNPVYFKNEEQTPDFPRVLVHFENGYKLAFNCMRMLGELDLIKDKKAFIKAKDLGPDVSDEKFDYEAFYALVQDRGGMIKSSLMDQQLMAGIGNECSDEILFQSRIHPKKKVKSLRENELKTIFDNVRKVIKKKVEALDHNRELPDSFLLKDREEGAECPNCKGAIEKITVGGRSGFYCPSCQEA
ncbi:Fpg/Nei family DNA glycosylase [Gracilimonas sp. Q87]|uniref:Fpg/Nei family DNA glycosylase n=1 Tax=Gracilimonas sp. Q87 TaxID=3384766 RepID=UPI003983EFEC